MSSLPPAELSAYVEGLLRARHQSRWEHLSDRELYRRLASRLQGGGSIPSVDPNDVVHLSRRLPCPECRRVFRITGNGKIRRHRVDNESKVLCQGSGVRVVE